MIPSASRLNQVRLKLAGRPFFFFFPFSLSRKTDNSLLIVVKENTGKSKHGQECGRWARTRRSCGGAENNDRCSGRRPINDVGAKNTRRTAKMEGRRRNSCPHLPFSKGFFLKETSHSAVPLATGGVKNFSFYLALACVFLANINAEPSALCIKLDRDVEERNKRE